MKICYHGIIVDSWYEDHLDFDIILWKSHQKFKFVILPKYLAAKSLTGDCVCVCGGGTPEILCTQGCIETGNGSVQMLCLSKKCS